MVANYLQGLVKNGDAFTDMSFLTPWYQGLASGQLASFVGPQWADALLARSPVASPASSASRRPRSGWPGIRWTGRRWRLAGRVQGHGIRPRPTLAQWMLTNPQAQVLNYKSGYGWPTTTSGAKIPEVNATTPYFGGQNPGPIYTKSNQATEQNWQWGLTTTRSAPI